MNCKGVILAGGDGRAHGIEAWLDTGTHQSVMAAGQFSATLAHRQGLKTPCPEAIAWRNGFVDARLHKLAQPLPKNGYGQYRLRLLKEDSER